jgi:hypothetical protein
MIYPVLYYSSVREAEIQSLWLQLRADTPKFYVVLDEIKLYLLKLFLERFHLERVNSVVY